MFPTYQLNRGVVHVILITPRRSDGNRMRLPWQNIAAPREILVAVGYSLFMPRTDHRKLKKFCYAQM